MRYCPVCDERYNDDTIKFCTKDGTPLIDDAKPDFVILPRERETGEETVIRRKGESDPFKPNYEPERIVIPPPSGDGPRIRAREARVYHPPSPPPQNTAKTVALTIVGTLVVLSFGAGLMWLFQKEPPSNMNVNMNPFSLNTDLNTNLNGFNTNFNFNFNTNMNAANSSNFNFNFNMVSVKTPTNTPTPRQTPLASPASSVQPSPSPSPRPPSPRPSVSPSPRPPAMTSNRPPANRNEN